MTPWEPIPPTDKALDEFDATGGAPNLRNDLVQLATRAQAVVPELIGVSIAALRDGLTFTLMASDAEIAALDAIQYAAGGPCVDGAQEDQVQEFEQADAMDEERWQFFAEATAAHAVQSTLTLPIVTDGQVTGTVNLYAGSRRAFAGHHEALAEIFGAWAAGAVINSDLSFTTRELAQRAPEQMQDHAILDLAVGMLAARLGCDVPTARERLRDAAQRAAITDMELARTIVNARRFRQSDEE